MIYTVYINVKWIKNNCAKLQYLSFRRLTCQSPDFTELQITQESLTFLRDLCFCSLRCVTPPPKFAAENGWNKSREEEISLNFSCDWHLRPVSPARRLSSSSCWMSTCLILSRPSGVFQKHLCFQSSSIKDPAEMQCNLNMLNIKRVTSKTFRTSSLTLTEARTIMHKPVGCVFGTPTFLFFFSYNYLNKD